MNWNFNTLHEKDIRIAARAYCKSKGLNPDEIIPIRWNEWGETSEQSERWKTYAPMIEEQFRIYWALQETLERYN